MNTNQNLKMYADKSSLSEKGIEVVALTSLGIEKGPISLSIFRSNEIASGDDADTNVANKKTYLIGAQLFEDKFSDLGDNDDINCSLDTDIITKDGSPLFSLVCSDVTYEASDNKQFKNKFNIVQGSVFSPPSQTPLSVYLDKTKSQFSTTDNKLLKIPQMKFLLSAYQGILLEVEPGADVTITFNAEIVNSIIR